jgi:hypothetical protein
VHLKPVCPERGLVKRQNFYLSGMVNRHNVHVQGSENPHDIIENIRDSPKVNVFCTMTTDIVYYCPFFFAENTMELSILTCWRSG